MTDNLISVIVPVYNVEKYLNECIESIVGQSYKNLEIILVDDGATDNSGVICDEWKEKDNRINVVHKKNAGLGFARNSGLEVATGDYVMFIDSDDYIASDMIERLYDVAVKTNSDTVYCGLTRVFTDGSKTPVPAAYNNQSFEGEEIIDKVLLEMVGSKPEESEDAILYMSVWHAVYSMEIIKRYNIRFPSERQIMSEDIMFHIDYLRHAKKVTYIKDPLYFYRVNPKSLSQVYDANRFKRQKDLSAAIRKSLAMFLTNDRYTMREDRRLLGGARAQILAIVASNENKKLSLIKEISTDTQIKEILERYPYRINPIKHRVFNFALKHNLGVVLYLLAFLINKMRKIGK